MDLCEFVEATAPCRTKRAAAAGEGIDHFGGVVAVVNKHERVIVVAVDDAKRETRSSRARKMFDSISELGGGRFVGELKEIEKWRRRGWPPKGRE